MAVPASAVCSGTKSITSNGTVDVTGYKSANVNVPSIAYAGDNGVVTVGTSYEYADDGDAYEAWTGDGRVTKIIVNGQQAWRHGRDYGKNLKKTVSTQLVVWITNTTGTGAIGYELYMNRTKVSSASSVTIPNSGTTVRGQHTMVVAEMHLLKGDYSKTRETTVIKNISSEKTKQSTTKIGIKNVFLLHILPLHAIINLPQR